ncbi:MAG: FAD-dependent oxidoreductase [Bacteroidetes bacterium]|nr:FAD-dependent oxidoreductase [Bacteroidota bacterium]
MSLSNKKFLVVGLGLAGSLISYLLHKQGAKVRVVNQTDPNSASMVAAGMWNPLSFRRTVPTWFAPTMIKTIHQVYPEMEKDLSAKFFFPRKIVRYFPNEDYRAQWLKQAEKSEVSEFLFLGDDKWSVLKNLPSKVNPDPEYFGVVGEAGYVDLPAMIEAWKRFLMEQKAYTEAEYTPAFLDEDETLIYANGVEALNTLPELDDILRKNKGEVLTLKNEWTGDTILNNGKWLLPLEDGNCRLGASYDWRSSALEKSEEVKDFLLQKLDELLPGHESELLKHDVGLRPTTKDRRPLVGPIPNRERTYIFNGLGTRGVLIGPYCALALVAHLSNKAEIPAEMNVQRFF